MNTSNTHRTHLEILQLIQTSMDKIDTEKRSSAFHCYFREISESIKKIELDKNLTPLRIGDYVVLNGNYYFQREKAKIGHRFRVIDLRPHKKRKGGIGYKIFSEEYNYSYYVSRNAIIKLNKPKE